MRFSMLYSGEQILSFITCLVFYAGDSLRINRYFYLNSIYQGTYKRQRCIFTFHADICTRNTDIGMRNTDVAIYL